MSVDQTLSRVVIGKGLATRKGGGGGSALFPNFEEALVPTFSSYDVLVFGSRS